MTIVLGACPEDPPPGTASDVTPTADTGNDAVSFPDATEPEVWEGEIGNTPGAIGWPCTSNSDCNDGPCVEGPEGSVCTQGCVSVCPPDWDCKAVQLDTTTASMCIPRVQTLCSPCLNDTQCANGICRDLDGEMRCIYNCTTNADCPGGFECADDPDGTHDSQVCQPATGSCTCNTQINLDQRSCTSSNDAGTCYGFQQCNPTLGWLPCTATEPAAEDCDGVDNDCNGLIDDGLISGGACVNEIKEIGSCDGIEVCQGGLGWVCQGPIPSAEVCDYIDNDCDGTTDAEFRDTEGNWTLAEHCGECNNNCATAIANGTGTCGGSLDSPVCVVSECDPGFVQVNDFQCLPPLDVGCQPCSDDFDCYGGHCLEIDGAKSCIMGCQPDNTCVDPSMDCVDLDTVAGPAGELGCVPASGTCTCTDATDGQQQTCTEANAFGTCFGIRTCFAGVGWTPCTAVAAQAEVCDGFDNDCDGLIDDNIEGEGDNCVNSEPGIGSCNGTFVCLGNQGLICQGPVPTQETCDFKDNDCDGSIDEDFRDNLGFWTLTEHCGTCGNNCLNKIEGGTGQCGGDPTAPVCVVDTCDEGLVPVNAFQCNAPPDVGCQPCQDDSDCFGGTCTTIDNQQVCAMPCDSADNSCPASFACTDVGGGVNRCTPVTGTCTCTAAVDGQQSACTLTNTFGTCFGIRTCDASVGWTTCTADTPEAEICDGVDNDCDGLVDDEISEIGQPCQNTVAGVGACDGINVCLGTQGLICNAATPVAETCDYQDNNCDGNIDEDFKTGEQYTDFDHCGACNTSCSIGFPNAASTECSTAAGSPECVVVDCEDGFVKISKYQCVPNVSNLCSSCTEDSDCLGDNAACVDLGGEQVCGQGCGAGNDCPDGYNCQDVGAATNQCVPDSGSCTCDGTNLTLSRQCEQTFTPPAPQPEYTCIGIEQCTVSGWGACQLPAEECDGADNDCDGQVDEDFKDGGGTFSSVQHCGGCNISCLALNVPFADPVCDTSGAIPQCTYECLTGYFDVDGLPGNGCECEPQTGPDLAGDGVDSDCDGIDGELDSGVFVAKNGNDTATGAIDDPLLTIGAGLALAASQNKRDVYVATGVYSESITLEAGVGLFGGYSSDFLDRDVVLFETAIIGSAPTGSEPGAVNAVGIGVAADGGDSGIDGFTIFGANAANTPGANSYAVYLRNVGPDLSVTNCKIFGGAGGNGATGTNGVDGINGTDGSAGLNAYDPELIAGNGSRQCGSAQELNGGSGGSRFCSGVNVSGGSGGQAACPVYSSDPATTETNGGTGSGPGGGTGGANGWDSGIDTDDSCTSCSVPPDNNPWEATDGLGGNDGSNGAPGSGCSDASGSIVGGQWVASGGTDGVDGGPGGGGGGGGAGGGVDVQGNSCEEVDGPPELGDCCEPKDGITGCSALTVEACVCAQDSYCCAVEWDGQCVNEIEEFGCEPAGTSCSEIYIGGHDVGGSGGGGGSGACGGTSGGGGSGGGGSFGLFLVYDTSPAEGVPVISGNTITRGSGGTGGPGGPAGAGGDGGSGALGGLSGSGGTLLFCAAGGGAGAEGGDGGHGGGGGGGCGGVSYGIYAAQTGAADLTGYNSGNTYDALGSGGSGGPGGASTGQGGSAGAAGSQGNTNF